MLRKPVLWLSLLMAACSCGGGAAGANGGTATDATVAADTDSGTADAKSVDNGSVDAAADIAVDAAVVETTLSDASPLEVAADVPVDADAADVLAEIGAAEVTTDVAKEVADIAAAEVTPPDAVAADSAADAKAEVVAPKEGQCASEVSCKNAMMCIAPGESIGCGMCMKVETACDSDASCNPPDTICKPLKCACGGESTCQPGCKVAADCAEGFFCAPTGKCFEDVCKVTDPPGADKNCKPNFVCKNPANPHCFRKECKASSECEGYCVKGLCYSAPGQCSYPPP